MPFQEHFIAQLFVNILERMRQMLRRGLLPPIFNKNAFYKKKYEIMKLNYIVTIPDFNDKHIK